MLKHFYIRTLQWWSIALTHRTILRGLVGIMRKVIPKVIPKSHFVSYNHKGCDL